MLMWLALLLQSLVLGGPGILCHFILCFPCVLAGQADFQVICTPSYFSQVFSSCEDEFALGLVEHTALLETALPPLTKTRGAAIVISLTCQWNVCPVSSLQALSSSKPSKPSAP